MGFYDLRQRCIRWVEVKVIKIKMVIVLGTVYGLEGTSKVKATERVEFIFNLLNTNGDEEISEEEFIRGCLEDQELVKLLHP